MAGDDTGSNVGLKGKVATEPTIESPLAHPSDKLNITFPDTFHGDRKKLKSFLIQTELWMAFNAKHFNKEVEQILWAVPLFRGPASEWISNYLADYMNHRTPDEKCNTSTSQGTKEIFVSWNRFLKTLKALKTRGVEMLRRGLKSLDELDEAEEKESREAEVKGTLLHSPSTAVSEGVASEQDLLAVLSPDFFERWGADGETPPAILDS
ncbi:hypothetical protein VC83_06585 [Pseudogymnoascus destructans]|uniref:DUF4939 domain-containing protein n=1 Tax=Pseudogymnoascus destructans TaxID=655981 RepID=A0A177A7U7_9PEZI|nr:uncharacterized protein VC83_06585 [Pseudogymnoascus destructans]OAF58219.1 hypothetical protein VC83_06585 [Pseudogymnoascus destructans]